jgi:mRNA-degrading endonuclease RelE of RelBE toxin-antitoxin system
MLEILYSQKAAKQLRKIRQGNRKNAIMIMEAIEQYAENPQGNYDIKILKGKFGEFKRLRAGNYRIIFNEEGKLMFIYEVKHRQGAYND